MSTYSVHKILIIQPLTFSFSCCVWVWSKPRVTTHVFIVNWTRKRGNIKLWNLVPINVHTNLLFKIHSHIYRLNRQDLTKTCDYFCAKEMKRRLHDDWHKDPGCQGRYLFNIPLDHIVIDELHMLLRVMDRMEHALIFDDIDWDEVSKIYYVLQ